MRIVLTAVGTAGDVLPFIGLGRGLREQGHDVLLVTHSAFAQSALRCGLGFAPVGTEAEYNAAVRSNPRIWDPADGYDEVARCAVALVPQLYEVLLDNVKIPDTVIVAHYLDFAAPLVQAAFDTPVVTALTSPAGFNYADRYLARIPLPDPLARLRDSGGDGWALSGMLSLCLFPHWFAPSMSPPASPVLFAGFPRYDEVAAVPPEVCSLMDSGDPFVIFALGSRVDSDDADSRPLVEAAAKACSALGVRGLLLGGSGIAEGYELLHAPFAPLSKVLPRATAIVHHGGIGTIAAALGAGVPQLAIPVCHDQPVNSQLMAALGVGTVMEEPVTGTALGDRLTELTSSSAVTSACRDIRARTSGVDTARSVSAALSFLGRRTAWRSAPVDDLSAGLPAGFELNSCNCAGACGAGWA